MPIDPKKIEEWKRWAEEAKTDAARGHVDPDTVEAGLAMDAVPALLAEREEMLALLREVEWAPSMSTDPPEMGEDHDRCPKCLAERRSGHAPDCRLASLLR